MNTGVGVAFAVLLFGERLSLWIWLAVALVFAGVAIVNRTHRLLSSRASARRETRDPETGELEDPIVRPSRLDRSRDRAPQDEEGGRSMEFA